MGLDLVIQLGFATTRRKGPKQTLNGHSECCHIRSLHPYVVSGFSRTVEYVQVRA
jgi:hypothetical protein